MLPQMMPLPWIFVFIFLFTCFYTISLSVSLLNLFYPFAYKSVKLYGVCVFW